MGLLRFSLWLERLPTKLPSATHLPFWLQGQNFTFTLQPIAILDKKVIKFQNQAQVLYLIQWAQLPAHDATWETTVDFEAKFPEFMASLNLGSSST